MDRIKEKIIKDFMNTNSITHEDIVNASNISDPEIRSVLLHRVIKLLNKDTLKEENLNSSNGSIEDKDDDKPLSLIPFNFEEVNRINDIRFKGKEDLQKKYCDLLEIDNISTTVLEEGISGKGIIDLSNFDNYKDLKAENLHQLEIKIKESENDKEKKVGTIPNGKNILSASFIVHNNKVKENNKSKSSEETDTNSNTSNPLNIKINIDSNLNKSVLDNYIKSVEDYLVVLKYYKNHSNSLNEESTSASITKEIELLLLKNYINYSNWKTKYTGDLQKWNIQSLIPFAIYLRNKLVNEQNIFNGIAIFLDNGSRIYDTSFPYFNLINLIDDRCRLKIDKKLTSSCKEIIFNLYNHYSITINIINNDLDIIQNYNDIIQTDNIEDLNTIQTDNIEDLNTIQTDNIDDLNTIHTDNIEDLNTIQTNNIDDLNTILNDKNDPKEVSHIISKNFHYQFYKACDRLTTLFGHTESHLISYLLFGHQKFDFNTQYIDLCLYIKNIAYRDDLEKYLKEEVIGKSSCNLSDVNTLITLQIKSIRRCCTMCKSNIQILKEEIDSALKKIGFKGTFNITFYYQEDKENKGDKKSKEDKENKGDKKSKMNKQNEGNKKSKEDKENKGDKKSKESKEDKGDKNSKENKENIGDLKSKEDKQDEGDKKSKENKQDRGIKEDKKEKEDKKDKEEEKKKTKKELYIETEQKVLSSIGKSLSIPNSNNTKSNLNKISILQLSTNLNLFFEAFKKNCKNKKVLEEFNKIQKEIWKDSESNSKYIEIKQKQLIKQSENIFISGALSSNKKSSN